MTLAPHSRLGPYEIVAPLGAGGMGEVYRARDSRLGREVAVKVLPESVSRNPELRARFEREAKTVSSLNHPHICVLHDVGREGDTDFLVMELVEGETLAQRLSRGALPLPEVVRLGGQIADALDRAHRAGVVHRDLKPGNVMVTKSGVKLMDFGLARVAGVAGGAAGGGSLTHSPTVAQALTAEGTLVGTFQYMGPEQLEGKEADARSDLWALGCVLYEMATGRRAFEGKSQASLISAIMTSEPPPIATSGTRASGEAPPAALDQLVRALLAKDPDDRVQTAHDAKLQLGWIAAGGSQAGAAPVALRRPRRWLPLAGVVAVAAAFAGGALLAPRVLPQRPAGASMILDARSPDGVGISGRGGDFAFSPDGRAFAFVGSDSTGEEALWIRPLDGTPARRLSGTAGAQMPFWSPDGRSLGFFAGGRLRTVARDGGTPADLCPAPAPRGGSWGKGGAILFAATGDGPLLKVPAEGGVPSPATVLDTAKREVGHRFPRFLPGGTQFFYATTPVIGSEHEIYLASLGSPGRRFVLRCDGVPEFTPEGWLVYRKNGLLHAQRFDPRACRLSGPAQPMVAASQGVGLMASPAAWSAPGGLLAFFAELPRNERLAWVDREGRERYLEGLEPGGWIEPRVSPDGTRAVATRYAIGANSSSGLDLWMVDLVRERATRFTFDPEIEESPIWSGDGRHVIFDSNRSGSYELFRQPAAAGADPERLATGAGFVMTARSATRDGRWLVYEAEDAKTSRDVWLLSLDSSREMKVLLGSSASETEPEIAPDGRTLAYVSDESGRPEIYAQAFPGLGRKVQVSFGGGLAPRWRADGRELYYRGLERSVYAVAVTPGPEPTFGAPVRLFRPRYLDAEYDVAPDGQRFLFALTGVEGPGLEPQVMVNWPARLR